MGRCGFSMRLVKLPQKASVKPSHQPKPKKARWWWQERKASRSDRSEAA